MGAIQESKDQEVLNQITSVLKKQIAIAESASDGFSHVFTLPHTVNGEDYAVLFMPNEVTFFYDGKEKPVFLVSNVTNYSLGKGENRISKFAGVITLVNSTGVCGNSVIEKPNFHYQFEECEQDSDCVSNVCVSCSCV
ncbi:hypothetical protein C4573_05705 [Candidatus Woesearchaeota archaeon]|nr:MAG: hypothetical protein C4573_05705 [Candidatus Woesearchaeota archaeon]